MILKENLIPLGHLGKTHGLHGELHYSFTFDAFENEEVNYLIIKREGILVPFFVEDYREKSATGGFLKFDGIDSEEQARTFVGAEVFLPKEFESAAAESEKSLDFFVGFQIITEQAKEKIIIADVDTSLMANPLFVAEIGGNEVLIPVNENLIENIDYEKREITMNLPEGLLEL